MQSAEHCKQTAENPKKNRIGHYLGVVFAIVFWSWARGPQRSQAPKICCNLDPHCRPWRGAKIGLRRCAANLPRGSLWIFFVVNNVQSDNSDIKVLKWLKMD